MLLLATLWLEEPDGHPWVMAWLLRAAPSTSLPFLLLGGKFGKLIFCLELKASKEGSVPGSSSGATSYLLDSPFYQ